MAGGIVASLQPKRPIAAQLAAPPGGELKSWMAESCIGSYPLEMIVGSTAPGEGALAAGGFAVLNVALSIDGVSWLGAAPLFTDAT
jgi:hypothetical protein